MEQNNSIRNSCPAVMFADPEVFIPTLNTDTTRCLNNTREKAASFDPRVLYSITWFAMRHCISYLRVYISVPCFNLIDT